MTNKEKTPEHVVSEAWAEISQDFARHEVVHHTRQEISQSETLTPWLGYREERKRRRDKKHELPGPPTFLRGTTLRT